MSKFLLDSHVLIWWQEGQQLVRPEAGTAIASGQSQLYFSHASIWELNIKTSRGRLTLPEPLEQAAQNMRCNLLPISLKHIEEVKQLPHHHGDPFDRMLIAQARTENLTIITRDSAIGKYDVATLAA